MQEFIFECMFIISTRTIDLFTYQTQSKMAQRPPFCGYLTASGQGEIWDHYDGEKFKQFGWRCTTNETEYSNNTLIGNWREERSDTRYMAQNKPIPSQVRIPYTLKEPGLRNEIGHVSVDTTALGGGGGGVRELAILVYGSVRMEGKIQTQKYGFSENFAPKMLGSCISSTQKYE